LQPSPSASADRLNNPASPLRALFPTFLYFIAAGIATVMLGPLLPSLIPRWHIQDAQAGTLFTASFVGQFCGAWFATRNLRASIIFGSAITAAGCFAMGWVGFELAHIALFCMGLGLGAGLTAGNVIAGTAVPAARARLIAMLNVAWGIGAIACPMLVRVFSTGGMQHFFFATAAFLAITSVISIAIPYPAQSAGISSEHHPASQAISPHPRMPLPAPLLLIFGAAIFLYVGIENALGGWLPSYAIRVNPTLHSSSIALYFWMAELAGRILVTILIARFSEAALYRLCLVLLIAGQALLCASPNISSTGIVTLTVLAALSLAPLYPLLISFLIARTGNHARLGALFATASFGGATLPWLTGIVSTRFQSLRAGLLVPAASAVVLLLLSAVTTSKPRTKLDA
jgi:FHS family glucose/mannose:H+ symporter-like MFS transporter